jgi:excisionase family DNA binding protein
VDTFNRKSGWLTTGSWTVPGSGPRAVVSTIPSTGTGSAQVFIVTMADGGGTSLIAGAYFLVNSALTGVNACMVEFNRSANTLRLLDNTGLSWLGPLTIGTAGSVSNSQCTLNGGGSTSIAGNNLTVNIPLSFAFGFSGAKSTFANVVDIVNQKSGWVTTGSWTVPSSGPLAVVDTVPGSGTGSAQIFSVTAADGGGAEAQIESELVTLREQREEPITEQLRRELLSFARDLPKLWDDSHGLPEHKKRLLRIALKEIIATSEDTTIRLVVHWQGGDHTQIEFPKIRSGRHRYVTDEDLVELVRMLARIEPDAWIASILNRNQRRTAHQQTGTPMRVCSLRNNHGIPVYREGERQARREMSVSEAATVLGVTPTTVLRLIRVKQLPATQACVGAPWILHREEVERCLARRNQPSPPPTVNSEQLTLEIP